MTDHHIPLKLNPKLVTPQSKLTLDRMTHPRSTFFMRCFAASSASSSLELL